MGAIVYTVTPVRAVTQDEAMQMRAALKTIAGFYNPAAAPDGAQAAAKLARETLERVALFYERDANPRGDVSP